MRHRVDPVYPSRCRRRGHAGVVLVRVLIGADGTPRRVTLRRASGCERLGAAALVAVRDYRFFPAVLNGQAIASSETIEVLFRAR